MQNTYDCLVIGAGFAGAVAARELAERAGKRVLVLERRGHIGGNAYDLPDEHGGSSTSTDPISSTQPTAGSLTISPALPGGGTISTGWWPMCTGPRCPFPST